MTALMVQMAAVATGAMLVRVAMARMALQARMGSCQARLAVPDRRAAMAATAVSVVWAASAGASEPEMVPAVQTALAVTVATAVLVVMAPMAPTVPMACCPVRLVGTARLAVTAAMAVLLVLVVRAEA